MISYFSFAQKLLLGVLCGLIIICINTLFLLAQNIDAAALRLKYPDEDALFLNRNEHLRLDYSNGAWDIVNEVYEETYYLTPLGQGYGTKTIFYSSFEDISDINARTLLPIQKGNKTKYDEIKVTNVEETDAMVGSVFYSDYKQKKIVFPSATPGSITRINYRETIKDPHMLTPFYFSTYAPTQHAEFVLTVPKHIVISYKLMGENSEAVKFSKTEDAGLMVYKWTAEDMPKIEREANAPDHSYYAPHVIVFINNIVNSDGSLNQSVLADTKDLYSWYSSLVENVNKSADNDLKKLVATLTATAKDDTEKARRIFAWVQDNIKYIAFEDGLGGLVPREAKDIMVKKYGDCKDMSSITVEMLRTAGVPAYLTWIGTRDKPYRYQDVPSPVADNHMIACAKLNGQFVFLDATGGYMPLGMPTSMIQGKEALIGISPDKYEIMQVPVIEKKQNAEIETVNLQVEDRQLKGKANVQLTGYKKTFAEYDYNRAKANADKGYFLRRFQKGTNKFAATLNTEKGYFDPEKPIEINYDFEIPDYVKVAGDKMYINLNLDKRYKNANIDLKKRKTARESEFKYIEQHTYFLQIPEGYAVEYMPPNNQYNNDLFGFTISYRENAGKVEVQQQVYCDFLLLNKGDFAAWNEMMQKLDDTYQEVLVLKKK